MQGLLTARRLRLKWPTGAHECSQIACIAGTFDTKADELNYISDLNRAAGLSVRTFDLETTGLGF